MKKKDFSFMDEKFLHPLLKELLNNPLMGINITDGKGRVLYLNKAHRRITGQDPALYLGRTMEEIAGDGMVSESATVIVLRTKQAVSINQVTSRRNHYFQVHAVPLLDENGDIRYVINYLINSSDIVSLKNRIDAMNRATQDISAQCAWVQRYLNRSGELIYRSKLMQDVVEASLRVAEYEVSVLITGPSGVGKEMIANLIHSHSSRSSSPFIKINCAAIPAHLLESELFGYEPGAFTGGNPKGKLGLIERSSTGTLLLDEIGELPPALQSKLLRVLQTHTLRHIGGHDDIHVDFRLICSTNADLARMIRDKTFRDDLYYRINVVEINIPPLSERPDDIPPLANYFLQQANTKYGTDKSFHPYALHYLSRCSYPGNVRELQNVIERAIIMSNDKKITQEDMAKAFSTSQTAPGHGGFQQGAAAAAGRGRGQQGPGTADTGGIPGAAGIGQGNDISFPKRADASPDDPVEGVLRSLGLASRETGVGSAGRTGADSEDAVESLSLKELMARCEKAILVAYQKKYKTGVKIAEVLKTDQSTISRKLTRYQIGTG